MKKILLVLVPLFSVFLLSTASAGEREIRQALQGLDPNTPVQSIKPAKIDGLFEVVIGNEVYYVSANGRYIFNGDIYDASTRENLTSITRGKIALKIIDKVGESGMIIYEPKKVRRTLTVFTDVDCPYCRKFHDDLPQHLANGIRVRYVMFPLRGLKSNVYRKEVSVWCSKDRKKALDEAKAGKAIKVKQCANPIADNYILAQKLGVNSTPTLMTDKGVLLPGYMPPAHLAARLGLALQEQAKNP
jgi:thiol:disulfide interchange protein DsbC